MFLICSPPCAFCLLRFDIAAVSAYVLSGNLARVLVGFGPQDVEKCRYEEGDVIGCDAVWCDSATAIPLLICGWVVAVRRAVHGG